MKKRPQKVVFGDRRDRQDPLCVLGSSTVPRGTRGAASWPGKHHTPAWASHPIAGTAPWHGHSNPLLASQPTVGVLSWHGHRNPSWVLQSVMGVAYHHRYRNPSRASHPITAIAPQWGCCIPSQVSHPIPGVASHQRYHTPSRASHPIAGIAPHPGCRIPSRVSHPTVGIQVTWGSPQKRPAKAGRGGGGTSRVVLPAGSSKLPGGKLNLFPHHPACRGNVTPGNGQGCSGYYCAAGESL